MRPYREVEYDVMGREIIRATQTPRQAPEANVMPEAERLAKRAEVKYKLAAAQLAEIRLGEFDAGINAINSRKDELAAEHVAICEPLQRELQQIEQKQIAAILGRGESDESLEARRKELLSELQKNNADLEEAIAAQDRLFVQVRQERNLCAKACNESSLITDLYLLGDFRLRMAHKVSDSANTWAVRRLESCKNKLATFPEDEFLAHELVAAEAEAARTRAAAEEAYQATIDE